LKTLIQGIREKQYKAVDTTISYSNLSRWVKLDKRFIGEVLFELLTAPGILDQPMPVAWSKKSESLYLSVFFQNEQRAAIYRPLIEENPEQDADIYWELYASTIKFAPFEEAIGYLEQAVERDSTYGLAYTDLANKAWQRGMSEMAARMWQQAAAAFPENPYIELQRIKAESDAGSDQTELRLALQRLRQLPWSDFYSGEVKDEIDAMLTAMKP